MQAAISTVIARRALLAGTTASRALLAACLSMINVNACQHYTHGLFSTVQKEALLGNVADSIVFVFDVL